MRSIEEKNEWSIGQHRLNCSETCTLKQKFVQPFIARNAAALASLHKHNMTVKNKKEKM